MSAPELPIVLKLWACDVPNSGVDTRGTPDEAADLIKEMYEALAATRKFLTDLGGGPRGALREQVDAILAKARGEA